MKKFMAMRLFVSSKLVLAKQSACFAAKFSATDPKIADDRFLNYNFNYFLLKKSYFFTNIAKFISIKAYFIKEVILYSNKKTKLNN